MSLLEQCHGAQVHRCCNTRRMPPVRRGRRRPHADPLLARQRDLHPQAGGHRPRRQYYSAMICKGNSFCSYWSVSYDVLESVVNQCFENASALHTFSAKERDSETGLSYFGARYYSSDLSIWLSVDPMSDKYPSLSPYVYCADNPVKLVDPNGEEIRKYVDYNTGEFLGEIDDGIDETLRVTKEDYEILKNRYDYDISNGNTDLPLYNGCLERNSIGKKGYDIAQIALSYKGSTQWAYSVRKDNFAAGKNKCNKFIYDVLLESNASASYSGRAPLAGEWADPKVMIPDWAVVTGSPRVGDVIAGGHSFEDASGHVAIVTHVFESGYIETMSANKSNVQIETFGNSVLKNKGKWGKTTYKPITIRRYAE